MIVKKERNKKIHKLKEVWVPEIAPPVFEPQRGKFDGEDDFQTPEWLCEYIVSLINDRSKKWSVLEPTPGKGNLVKALKKEGFKVTAPKEFFDLPKEQRFDFCVMNPPYNPRSLTNKIFEQCMRQSYNIIALVPYEVLTNGTKRHKKILRYGLRKVIHVDRYKAFKNIRVNICILVMWKGYKGETIYDSLSKPIYEQ